MRLKVLAVFAALASLSVPHSSRATDFSATTKSIVSSLNQISEIYQKPQITNGDAVAIAASTCEEIKISIDNGNIQFIAEVVYQYPAKNPGDPAYKQVNPEKLVAIEEDLLTKAGANSATKELILRQISENYAFVTRSAPEGVDAHLINVRAAACDFASQGAGDPKAEANSAVQRLALSFTKVLVGLGVATVDLAFAADSGLAVGVAAFVSTSWGWDWMHSGWEEATEAWKSLTGRENLEVDKNQG
jgi:hypothetical protein